MMQNHLKVNDSQGKHCPSYEHLCIVFRKDCASDKNGQGPEEMEDVVNEEEENEESSKKSELESSYTQEPFGVETTFEKSMNLGKMTQVFGTLANGLSKFAFIIGREIRAASSEISRTVDFDVVRRKKCSKINEELNKLGLKTMERHEVTRKISFN